MLQIHLNTRTTSVTRAEIARSGEPIGLLAQRYDVSTEPSANGASAAQRIAPTTPPSPAGCRGRRPREQRAIVCAVRRATNFPLGDLTFVVGHFLPHLNRDRIWRILKAEGLNRCAKPVAERPAKGRGNFKEYDLGFIHIDIKHLPKLQTADGERRKRCLFVAIDRRSRSVHLAVQDDETERSAWDCPALMDTLTLLSEVFPPCPRVARRIHLSSVARWSSWSVPDARQRTWPTSSSPLRSQSATGSPRPTSRRAAGRRAALGLTTAERDELARLRREVRQLRVERDILSKSRGLVLPARPGRSPGLPGS